MFNDGGYGDGYVFCLCRGGNGRCGQQGQKHRTHENLPCFGALLIGKHLFSNNLRLKVYPPDLRLNRVRIDCQRVGQPVRIEHDKPATKSGSNSDGVQMLNTVFSTLSIWRRAAIFGDNNYLLPAIREHHHEENRLSFLRSLVAIAAIGNPFRKRCASAID